MSIEHYKVTPIPSPWLCQAQAFSKHRMGRGGEGGLWSRRARDVPRVGLSLMHLIGSFPDGLGFRGGAAVKNVPAVQEAQETQLRPLGQEGPLEEGMATHSSILA